MGFIRGPKKAWPRKCLRFLGRRNVKRSLVATPQKDIRKEKSQRLFEEEDEITK